MPEGYVFQSIKAEGMDSNTSTTIEFLYIFVVSSIALFLSYAEEFSKARDDTNDQEYYGKPWR